MTITVLYFAWLRERIGHSSERVQTNAKTPAQLIDELRARGLEYQLAFEDISAVRVSINQRLCEFSDPIPDGAELAFFPPMTGG